MNFFKVWLIVIIITIAFGIVGKAARADMQDVMRNISKTPYDELRYNCWDYATDLQVALLKENITSRIIIGMLGYTPHAWIEVNKTWIEPTIGQTIAKGEPYRFGYYGIPKFYNPWKKSYLNSTYAK